MTLMFKPKHVDLILSGRKTQTRRLWDVARVKVGGTYWASTHLYKESARFARLKVTAIRRESLAAISEEDARAEGYDSVVDFHESFWDIHAATMRLGQTSPMVWVVEFKVVKPCAPVPGLQRTSEL